MRGMSLFFDEEEVVLYKGSYTLAYSDVEAVNKSEGGTTVREVIREGVPKISVKTYASDEWFQKFRQYKAQDSIEVAYYDPEELAFSTMTAYMSNFAFELVYADASVEEGVTSKTLWKVSFDILSY